VIAWPTTLNQGNRLSRGARVEMIDMKGIEIADG